MEKQTISEQLGVGINLDKLPVLVKHQELKRIGDSVFKSQCPKCEHGMLMMEREFDTYKLKNMDRCLLCGQRFVYYDIDNARSFGVVYKQPHVEGVKPKQSLFKTILNILKY